MRTRQEILKSLVALDRPIQENLRDLQVYGWDWEGEPLVIITRGNIIIFLEAYIKGKLSVDNLRDWANSLECRDDIGYEKGYANLIRDTITDLSNINFEQKTSESNWNFPITLAEVQNIINTLQTAPFNPNDD